VRTTLVSFIVNVHPFDLLSDPDRTSQRSAAEIRHNPKCSSGTEPAQHLLVSTGRRTVPIDHQWYTTTTYVEIASGELEAILLASSDMPFLR